MASPGRTAPPFFRLTGHPLRWRLLTELADSDYRVRELVDAGGRAAEPGLLPPAAAARRRAGQRHAQQLRRPRQLLPPGPGPLRRRAGRTPAPALHPALRRRRRHRAPRSTRPGPRSPCCSSAPATAPAHRSPRPCCATAPAARRRGQRRHPPQARLHPNAVRVLREELRHRHRRPAPAAPGHARRTAGSTT